MFFIIVSQYSLFLYVFFSGKISKTKSFYISYSVSLILIFVYSIETSIKFFIEKDFIEIRKSYFKK